jgi:hypothetical protein
MFLAILGVGQSCRIRRTVKQKSRGEFLIAKAMHRQRFDPKRIISPIHQREIWLFY